MRGRPAAWSLLMVLLLVAGCGHSVSEANAPHMSAAAWPSGFDSLQEMRSGFPHSVDAMELDGFNHQSTAGGALMVDAEYDGSAGRMTVRTAYFRESGMPPRVALTLFVTAVDDALRHPVTCAAGSYAGSIKEIAKGGIPDDREESQPKAGLPWFSCHLVSREKGRRLSRFVAGWRNHDVVWLVDAPSSRVRDDMVAALSTAWSADRA